MSASFHPGEIAVQQRAGRLSRAVIRDSIPEVAARFAVEQPVIVIAGRGVDQRMWTTMLAGRAGFIQVPDPHMIVVNALPLSSDPLASLVAGEGEVGTILWDSHRRMRVNGQLEPRRGGFAVNTVQVYSNCGRYISERHPDGAASEGASPDGADSNGVSAQVEVGAELTDDHVAIIRAADTFFIGTSHPDGPADASHRGGNPGFILVEDSRRLRWPNYNGNRMFMTLGNITLNPRVGLLFLDWRTGGMLQLSGRAHIDWDPASAASLPGAERVVEFTVDSVRQTRNATALRWTPAVLNKHNPDLASA